MCRTARVLTLSLALALIPVVSAYAADTGVDKLLTRFRDASAAWSGPLTALAVGTFGALTVLDLAYHCGYRMLLGQGQISDILGIIVTRVVTLSFFFFLLLNYTTIAPTIISSLGYAAKAAGGIGMTPQAIMASGETIDVKIMNNISIFAPGDSFMLVFLGAIIEGCFAWITATMVYVLVESYFIIGGAQIIMSFGGIWFLQDIPQNLLRTVLGIALKLYSLQLIASVGMAFINDWVTSMGTAKAEDIVVDIGQVFLLAVVTSRVPHMFERLVSHVNSGGAGDLVRTANVMRSGAATLGGAVTSLAGSVKALASAGALAAAQNPPTGDGALSASGRVAAIVGSTAVNLVKAKAEDVSRGLSGERTKLGQSSWRMSASMREQTRLAKESSSKPKPPAGTP